MRHQKKRHKLGRTKSHRKATLAALSTSLITHKRITTTVPKAKALRVFIEPLITRAKEDTTHNRRQVFRHLQDNQAVSTLFTEVSEQVGDRPGGYTRVVKLGRRAGDGAPLAIIELVDYNDVQPETGGGGRKRTRRGGGSGRRRSRPKGAGAKQQQETTTQTETESTVDTKEKGAETEPVEVPVADEQTTPVTDRTDTGDVPEEQLEQAKEAIEEQKADKKKAEAEAAAEAEPEAAEEDSAEEEAPPEAKAESQEQSADEGESAEESDDSEEKK